MAAVGVTVTHMSPVLSAFEVATVLVISALDVTTVLDMGEEGSCQSQTPVHVKEGSVREWRPQKCLSQKTITKRAITKAAGTWAR